MSSNSFRQFTIKKTFALRGGHVPPRRALSNNNILCCFSFWYLVVQNSDAAWGSDGLLNRGLAIDAMACQGLQILAAETRWEHPATAQSDRIKYIVRTEIDSANLLSISINICQ